LHIRTYSIRTLESNFDMKRLYFAILIMLSAVVLASSCGGSGKSAFRKDSKGNNVPVADYVCVAVDETFQPIFEIIFNDFKERNIKAFVDPLYMPEDSAIVLLMNDSVRSIVTTRKLTNDEIEYLKKRRVSPKDAIVAFDAVALVTNNASTDTLISVEEMKQILAGKITDWKQLKHSNGQSGEIEIVFDHNGSSTVRYMMDSLCAGQQLKGKLRSAKSNEEVVKYITTKKNAIGVIGADWIGNSGDTTRLTFTNDVRVMSVSEKNSDKDYDYFKPLQFYLYTGEYPMTRCLYMITTDPRTRSMEQNFYYYLTSQPNHNDLGQMLILKYSQLLPYMAVQSRSVVIKQY